MIQRKVRGSRGGKEDEAVLGERCLPACLLSHCNFDGKFPRGEPQIGAAEKVCVFTVVRDGMGNGRIAWDPRERGEQKQVQYVIWLEPYHDIRCLTKDLPKFEWGVGN